MCTLCLLFHPYFVQWQKRNRRDNTLQFILSIKRDTMNGLHAVKFMSKVILICIHMNLLFQAVLRAFLVDFLSPKWRFLCGKELNPFNANRKKCIQICGRFLIEISLNNSGFLVDLPNSTNVSHYEIVF